MSDSKTPSGVALSRRRSFIAGLGALAAVAGGGANLALAQSAEKTDTMKTTGAADVMGVDPELDNIIGDMNAPVTLVEYASMTCPHCASFHQLTMPDLKKKYIDTGKVRLVFREFPLDRIAFAAAALARCSGEKKFFPFLEMMFRQQQKWATGPGNPAPRLFKMVKQAGFDEKFFNDCMRNTEVIKRIETVMNKGREEYKVESTPTIFVNGKKLEGGNSLADIEKAMEPYLKG